MSFGVMGRVWVRVDCRVDDFLTVDGDPNEKGQIFLVGEWDTAM